MTEEEWMGSDCPRPMVRFVRGKTSARKTTLFASCCVRAMWEFLSDERSREAIRVAEKYADGNASEDDFRVAQEQARAADRAARHPERQTSEVPDATTRAAWGAQMAMGSAPMAMVAASLVLTSDKHEGDVGANAMAVSASLAALLRCIIGPSLFRPAALAPGSLTPTVTSLARAAYDERILPSGHLDPDRLSILSDALEEAGCREEGVLGHLRSPGPHVRGCWAVDLLLGKE